MLAPLSTEILASHRAEDYSDDVWWLLHSSDKGNELVLGLTSYLDDSGSDEGSQFTVIGGPILSRIHFKSFSRRWPLMLAKHHIEGALHMSDFGLHGRYSDFPYADKVALFEDAVSIIHSEYQYSVSISIPQVDFKAIIPDDEIRRYVAGPSALAFFSVVGMNERMAKKYELSKIAYLVDRGSKFYNAQLIDAHGAVVKLEMNKDHKPTGSLDFNTDDNVPALQAADMIAWSSRRNEVGKLVEEYAPLRKLIESKSHLHKTLPVEGIAMLAAAIYSWLVKHGQMPSWGDIIRP